MIFYFLFHRQNLRDDCVKYKAIVHDAYILFLSENPKEKYGDLLKVVGYGPTDVFYNIFMKRMATCNSVELEAGLRLRTMLTTTK